MHHYGHIDPLAVPPICYLYCLRAFVYALPSVWNANIPYISMFHIILKPLLKCYIPRETFSDNHIQCLFNLHPPHHFIYLFTLPFFFIVLVTSIMLHCLFV